VQGQKNGSPTFVVGRGFTQVTRSDSAPAIYCLSPSQATMDAIGGSTRQAPSFAVLVSPTAISDGGADPAMKALRNNVESGSSPCAGANDIAVETFSGNDPATGIDFSVALLALR
jgi:hypothetical protein